MIKKLQKRFIIIAMCSVALTLFLIIGSINYANYSDVLSSAEMRLNMLENGAAGMPPFENVYGKDFSRPGKKVPLSPEAPFDSRYFTVLTDKNGNILGSNTKNIAAIDDTEAAKIALSLLKKGKIEGITGSYAFRMLETEENITFVFLDHSRELNTFYSFLSSSLIISFCAFVFTFILVAVFSKQAIKPITESYEKQKRFITDAGHELKTPLTVINAANDVLELEYGESKWTKSISSQVQRLTELTNKLVVLSRMTEESGLNFSAFSLGEILEDCVSYFEAVEISRDKEIVLSIEDSTEFIGDEKAIAQLFTLLTDNALKYSPEGSKIHISLCRQGKNRIITFRNPAENIEKGNNDILFERFYRPDKSREKEKGGHGIGLAVAKAITDAHKGKITAESPDGRSFIVTVIL